MAVKIRLARGGRKKVARFRIVAADSRCRRDGKFIETLGAYNPQAEQKEFNYDVNRMQYWLNRGAQATETVQNLLKQDCYKEKIEAIEKGLDIENTDIKRKPERKRKTKVYSKKSSK
ncbi:MAG: 30S ribosomal protein S16 [Chitinispirillia bacterium]